MNERVLDAFNDQINEELYSSYVYLAMAAHFEAMNLEGFTNWMKLQAQEELAHAMRLFDHINRRGGRVVLVDLVEGYSTTAELERIRRVSMSSP